MLRDPLPALSHGGYGEMVFREMGRREEEEERRNGGGALLYPKPTCFPKMNTLQRTFRNSHMSPDILKVRSLDNKDGQFVKSTVS